jgi:MFS family permease
LHRERPRPLLDYVALVALWSGATGMQTVLFSWLVVGELGSSAEVVGLVEMSRVAPILLLLLLGGAAADRWDRRRLLMGLHLGAGLLATGLAGALVLGWLSLPLLVVYAVAMGVLTAFVLPARDAFLSDVAGGGLMRAATALTLAQFGAQALGTFAAGSARLLELGPALFMMAGLLLLGGAAARRLPHPERREPPPAGALRRAELGAGLREVLRSPALRSTLLLMTGVGLFFAGSYFVVMPIAIRDHFHGDVGQLSVFMTVLQLGTVCGACALLLRGRLARRGRALVLSMAGAALPLLVIASGVSFAGALGAAFVWGLGVALFQSIGRALIQEGAPPAQRARVLSVYSLAVMGASVVGSPFAGWLAGRLGPLGALGVAGLALCVFVAVQALLTPVWRLD